jgi:hypothetical protein
MRHSGIIALRVFSSLLLAGFIAYLCSGQKIVSDTLYLKETSFSHLPGWQTDHQEEALAPLRKSCARINKKDPADDFGAGGFAGSAGQWQEVCKKLSAYLLPTKEEAQKFFQDNFTPYEVWGKKAATGCSQAITSRPFMVPSPGTAHIKFRSTAAPMT